MLIYYHVLYNNAICIIRPVCNITGCLRMFTKKSATRVCVFSWCRMEMTGFEPVSKSSPTFKRLQFSLLLDKTADMTVSEPSAEFTCMLSGRPYRFWGYRIHLPARSVSNGEYTDRLAARLYELPRVIVCAISRGFEGVLTDSWGFTTPVSGLTQITYSFE